VSSDVAVAAIVVAYNGRDDLMECVRSVRAQTVERLDVIVVDNASTDDSIDRLSNAVGNEIRVLRRPTNGGYAAGANTGWRASDAPIVAILNQDLSLAPDCLEQMRRVLTEEPREALVTPKLVLKSDPSRVNAIGNDVHISGVTWCRGLGSAALAWHGVVDVTAVSGAAFMARRSFLEQLGGLDETFFMYMEDVDLSFRARLEGATCLAACDAVAVHDWSLGLSARKFRFLERNRRRVWDRYIGSADGRWLVLLQVELMGWLFAALRGRRYLAAKARVPKRRNPPQGPRRANTELILPILSTRYPYHVLFPRSRVVGRVGGAIDRVVAAWLRFSRWWSSIRIC
jgi:GT2 family glycosyltransferase